MHGRALRASFVRDSCRSVFRSLVSYRVLICSYCVLFLVGKVLRELQYIDSDRTVQLKGRVACEVGPGSAVRHSATLAVGAC